MSETGSIHYMGKSKAGMQDNCKQPSGNAGTACGFKVCGLGKLHST